MPLPQWPDRIYTFGSSDKARAAAYQTGARERRRACLAYEVTPLSTKKVEPFALRTTPFLQLVNPITPALARQPKHDLPSPVMFRRRGDPGCQEKRARVGCMPRRRFGGDLPVAARERGLFGVRRRAPFLSACPAFYATRSARTMRRPDSGPDSMSWGPMVNQSSGDSVQT